MRKRPKVQCSDTKICGLLWIVTKELRIQEKPGGGGLGDWEGWKTSDKATGDLQLGICFLNNGTTAAAMIFCFKVCFFSGFQRLGNVYWSLSGFSVRRSSCMGGCSELMWHLYLQGHVERWTNAVCHCSAQRDATTGSQKSLFQGYHCQCQDAHQ